MRPRSLMFTAAVGAALCAAPAISRAACGLVHTATHSDPARTKVFSSRNGEKAVLFSADLDVNTDGAARSYHPNDPRGRTLALNNMGNAITRIFDANGNNITCSPRQRACFTRFIETFERSRDAGYAPTGVPRFETTGIIPWQVDHTSGRRVPCTIANGPFAGYFVSQTALIVDRQADICDQSRYLDALSINAVVLPRNVQWASQGSVASGGDLVVLLDGETGRAAFALVGDRGPASAIGEGSVALAAALGGVTVPANATFAEIKALKRRRAHYLILPARNVPELTNRRFSQADIDRLGAEGLAAFGGVERLRSCI